MAGLFSAARLRRGKSFRRLTGVSVATFEQMVKHLRAGWEAEQRRKAKSGRPWEVGGLEDHLLVMPLYDRCYVTPGVHWLLLPGGSQRDLPHHQADRAN